MAYSRDDIRDAVERGGDEQMQVLRKHHEDAYPESRPTPGDVLRAEAQRLNDMGFGRTPDFELVETRVERAEPQLCITHVLRYKPLDVTLLTERYCDYA